MLLPTTLCLAAALALVNIWLAGRIGRVRRLNSIWMGDGGNDLLGRRMRAQLNFAENVPVVLVLVALIEFTGKGDLWLSIVAAVFTLGRMLHAIGMDGQLMWGRMAGAGTTFITQIGLAVVAVLLAAQVI